MSTRNFFKIRGNWPDGSKIQGSAVIVGGKPTPEQAAAFLLEHNYKGALDLECVPRKEKFDPDKEPPPVKDFFQILERAEARRQNLALKKQIQLNNADDHDKEFDRLKAEMKKDD